MEGQHFTQYGELIPLSAQNLIDCSKEFGNKAIRVVRVVFIEKNRILLRIALVQYVKINGGIDTEKSYPYEARDGKCRFNRTNIGANTTVSSE